MEENTILAALKMFWALMDFGVIGIVLLSGYFAGRYLTSPFISKHIGTAWRTLIVSAIFTAIYVLVVKKDGGSFEYTKLFVSYVTATSFYELFIKMLAKYIPSLPNSQTQNQMNHWVFETNGAPLSSVNDLVMSVGNQSFGNGIAASAISQQTQGQYYVENGYLCANANAFQTAQTATLQHAGGTTTYIAVPILRPKK